MSIKDYWNQFKAAPADNLMTMQNQRPIWVVMVGAAAFLILSAILYFQLFLAMDPCELCVYIRFSQCCIVIAGLIILIDPKNNILKFLGLLLAWYAVIQGWMWSYELMKIHDAAHMVVDASMDFFAAAGDAAGSACSTDPRFPLNLPLDEWLPFEFAPTGGCGEDDWTLLGMNMAHYCMIAYTVFMVCLAPLTFGWVRSLRQFFPIKK
ncbi:disulfide bond formation protein B [Shewanella marinintestina]|uniref:disulfide bond formation protein B n=1 Tax=Shewanella marinintestina TaxID=190305 RepID=UPI00200DAEC1|nr:disulfide bond formation protein B [Shewanella marinintestina]MCL1147307.1 disulfide bond formation protein B [Shewanella marinintestina]